MSKKSKRLKDFQYYVDEYRKIEEEYQYSPKIGSKKIEALLSELDFIRDEICFLKQHLNELNNRKNRIIQQINSENKNVDKEKSDRINSILGKDLDTIYYIDFTTFIEALCNEVNIQFKNLIIKVDIDTDILLGSFNSVSEFLINDELIFNTDYTEYIPIRLTIKKKYDFREPIVLEWFSRIDEIQSNGDTLINCLATNTRLNNQGSLITKLEYSEDYNNLVIVCPLSDLFLDNLNGMSENSEYDTVLRNSLIKAIKNNLEQTKDKSLKVLKK